MSEVLVPRENVNDETVTVTNILFESGSQVQKGDIIFELETSKVNVDVEAPSAGIIVHDHSQGDEILIGDILCNIGDGSEAVQGDVASRAVVEDLPNNTKVSISKAARKLALELGVDLSRVRDGLVSVSDVEKMALEMTKSARNESSTVKINASKILNNSIVIVGGGGHAKVCIDILRQTNEYEILGIIDSKLEIGAEILGVKVIGSNDSLRSLIGLGVVYAVNGVGAVSNPKLRHKIHNELIDIGFRLPNLIHALSMIEPSSIIGEGNQIMMGAIIGSAVQIGNGCIVNSGSVISHDCILRDHCHIAPGAILAGAVEVGENAVIGMGSTIYLGLKIGKDSIVYNGVNVLKNVSQDGVAGYD